MISEEVRLKIKKLRDNEDYTLAEIAEICGVSTVSVMRIVNGICYLIPPEKHKIYTKERCEFLGIPYPYVRRGLFEGRDFVRESVRIRDKHTCQQCKKKWNAGERRFDVHHLNGLCGKLSRGYDRAKDKKGLITLCHKCHMHLDSVRKKIRDRSSPRPNK